jgi:hypothetical protein
MHPQNYDSHVKAFSEKNADRLILAIITLTAAWLRFQYLGQPSLWWDEFITVGASLKPLPDMLSVLKHLGPSDFGVELFPPMQHVITHFLLSMGHNDVLVRLPSALAGVATIPAVYALSRKPLGRLSALTASLLLAVSVYHLHYSREARPYALFVLENVLALHCLEAALTEGRKKLFIGYGAAVAAMLYTSYMAAVLIFGQVLFALAFLVWLYASGGRQEAKALGWRLGLALVLAGVAYLPWVPGQLNVFTLLHDPSFKANFSLDFISSSLKEFAAFNYAGNFPIGWVFVAVGMAGAGAALAGGRSPFVLLMSFWAFMPVAGIFLTKAHMDLSSRYIFPVYLFLAVFTSHALGTAVNRLADRFTGCANPIFFARFVVVAALCLFFSGPSLASLGDYYSRETSHYKELASYLIEHRNNQDGILYTNPRNQKLIFDWYGRGVLRDARDIEGGGYRRDFLLAPLPPEGSVQLPLAVERTHLKEVEVMSLGIARTPVLPMTPDSQGRFVYSDNFVGFKMIEDVFQAHNLVPCPLTRSLTALDAGLPAWGVYRFQASKDRVLRKAALTITFSLRQFDFIPSDSAVGVSVVPAGQAPVKLATVTLDNFRNSGGGLVPADLKNKRTVTLPLDLTPALKGSGQFDLRLDFAASTRSGSIEVDALRLEAELTGPTADPSELPEALLAELPVAPWTAGRDLVISSAVCAFSLDGRITSPGVGSPGELAAYRLVHPDDKPVRVLPYQDGAPAVALYDPALVHPFLDLAPGGIHRVDAFPPGRREAHALKLKGALSNPVVTVGQTRLILPLSCPAPAELTVNPGGQAELTFSPLFTSNGLDALAVSASDNIRKNQDEDCLTCAEDRPCSLVYTVRSGLPITSARITAFPRVVSDASGACTVITQVSADNAPWREVNRYQGSGSGRWEGLKIPQYTKVRLDRPASELRVRFLLPGQAAQLWSAPDARMRLDARLDASNLPVPAIEDWPSQIGVSQGERVEILPLVDPQPFPDWLRRSR